MTCQCEEKAIKNTLKIHFKEDFEAGRAIFARNYSGDCCGGCRRGTSWPVNASHALSGSRPFGVAGCDLKYLRSRMCGIAIVATVGNIGHEPHEALVRRAEMATLPRGPDRQSTRTVKFTALESRPNSDSAAHYQDPAPQTISFSGCVLHLRGPECVEQPIVDDRSGNMLLWNGELFGGLPEEMSFDYENDNDGIAVLRYLTHVTSASIGASSTEIGALVAKAMVRLSGPWAFAFWHAKTQSTYFGRDPAGRRSLLVYRSKNVQLVSSVAFAVAQPGSSPRAGTGDDGCGDMRGWEPVVPDGVYILPWVPGNRDAGSGFSAPKVSKWPEVDQLRRGPIQQTLFGANQCETHVATTGFRFLLSLSKAVRKRAKYLHVSVSQKMHTAPVAVLFSGGIDCMLIAFLLGTFCHCHIVALNDH